MLNRMESIVNWLRRYVSAVFLALLVASFILWYIAKLSYTYTTEQHVRVNVDGQEFRSPAWWRASVPTCSATGSI